ncbi:MAG: hypothetical protein JW746_10205 [Candidatus Krumholzibacteriota bacterium]|nr:hypothetical protein [Candidatus Krumholzibacteriota bacterium]
MQTNDPENKKIILSVTGIVKQVFELSKSLNLSGFAKEELKLESIISIKLPDPINITGWHWAEKSKDFDFLCENIGVELVTIEPGKKYNLKMWTKEDAEPGRYIGDVVLETDFKDISEKKILFSLTITPDVQLAPRTVIMREMRLDGGKTKNFEKRVSLIAARGDSLQILEVIPDRDDITVNVRETRPGKAFSCVISIRPPAKSGKYEGTVTFITNYPGYERLELPIKGMVRVMDNE